MVTSIVKKNGVYFCGECRMRQPRLQPYCYFCEAHFSNYESQVIEKLMEEEHLDNEGNVFRESKG